MAVIKKIKTRGRYKIWNSLQKSQKKLQQNERLQQTLTTKVQNLLWTILDMDL